MCGVWWSPFHRKDWARGLSSEDHLLDVAHFWQVQRLHLPDYIACHGHRRWDCYVGHRDLHRREVHHLDLPDHHPLNHHHQNHHLRVCHSGDLADHRWRFCRSCVYRVLVLGVEECEL